MINNTVLKVIFYMFLEKFLIKTCKKSQVYLVVTIPNKSLKISLMYFLSEYKLSVFYAKLLSFLCFVLKFVLTSRESVCEMM